MAKQSKVLAAYAGVPRVSQHTRVCFAAYAGVPRVLQPCLSRFLLLAAATAAAATASAAAAPLRPIDQLRVNDQWLSAFGTVAFVE